MHKLEININDHLKNWFENKMRDKNDILRRAKDFKEKGYTKFKIGELVPEELMDLICEETNEIIGNHGIRRDLNMESTEFSPRHMSNVPQRFIEEYGNIIPTIYNNEYVKRYLGFIANDELVSCWKDEEYVINCLEKSGDTHGWHWGDYPFTVIWIIDAPPIENGGLLQSIPNTVWNKDNSQINQHLVDNTIDSLYNFSKEAYFLKSDTTLHQVTSVQSNNGESVRRVILNTCWASKNDPRKDVKHETVNAAFM